MRPSFRVADSLRESMLPLDGNPVTRGASDPPKQNTIPSKTTPRKSSDPLDSYDWNQDDGGIREIFPVGHAES